MAPRFPRLLITLLTLLGCCRAAVWHWAMPLKDAPGTLAFVWIPEDCRELRGVVFAQNNMLEEPILEHPEFRENLRRQGFAEILVAPFFDQVFRFDQGAGERFEYLLKQIAETTGYQELTQVPVVPLGHSACASFPWNFAAWNPERTLVILSVKGDAPLTAMTGSGKPNPDWGGRTIDGVPGLMVMGEFEWLEGRIEPALVFQKQQPGATLCVLAEAGRGHFDCSDKLVRFLNLFLNKAVQYRMSGYTRPGDRLGPLLPREGWRNDRWRLGVGRKHNAAPLAEYQGTLNESFWAFDEECALAVDRHEADQVGKRPQHATLMDESGKALPQQAKHLQLSLPLREGQIQLKAGFADQVGAGSPNLARWTGLPAGSPLGHSRAVDKLRIERVTGPIRDCGDGRFALQLNKFNATADRRPWNSCVVVSHPGDAEYKSSVQQAELRIQENKTGAENLIHFEPLQDMRAGGPAPQLKATASSGLPVSFYVIAGPVELRDGQLMPTRLPTRARLPLKVSVAAWQWGQAAPPMVKTAGQVIQDFQVLP